MQENYSLVPFIAKEIWDQLVLLAISGAGGAFFRAVLAPEEQWKRRVAQGVAGGVSAIFLGGLLAAIIETTLHVGVWGVLASGFLMGSAGEMGVKFIQERITGKQNG